MVRRLFGVIATVALASGAMVALVGPASAGEIDPLLTITVHKEISGTPTVDQAWQVRVQCVHDDEQFYGVTKDISWTVADGAFDPSDANAVFEIDTRPGGDSENDIFCTVLENGTAGAASHTIGCTADSGDAVCTDPDSVVIQYIGNGTADLTVTNVYPEPVTPPAPVPPAPTPLAAAARFTG